MRVSRYTPPIIFTLCLILIVAFWITSLFNQLSIDEGYTIWASNRSDFSESLKRVLFEWNQSPLYYAIPWSLMYLEMDAEWQLRIPSLVLGLISCAVILKITSCVKKIAAAYALCFYHTAALPAVAGLSLLMHSRSALNPPLSIVGTTCA